MWIAILSNLINIISDCMFLKDLGYYKNLKNNFK